MRRSLASFLVVQALVAVSCGGVTSGQAPTRSPSPSPAISPSPAEQPGPGGLTLDQEVGAVMMVGFQGPATGAVLADFRQHQFGGLLVVNLNANASSA